MKKNSIVRFSSLLILIFHLICVVTSCNTGTDEVTTPGSSSEEESSSLPEATVRSLDLLKDGKTEFSLLRPCNATAEQEELILYFREQFEKKTGIKLAVTYEKRTDDPQNDNFEILIGNSSRAEVVEITKTMRKMDYCYTVSGNKIILAGGCDDATKYSIQYFMRKFVDAGLAKDKNNLTFTSEDAYYEKVNYYLNDFKIGGIDASEFQIVYSESDLISAKNFAYELTKKISQLYGYDIKLVTDAAKKSEHEIIVGNTNRNHPNFGKGQCNIAYNSGNLYMHCSNSSGYSSFLNYVNSDYLKSSKNLNIDESKNVSLPLSEILTGGSENVLSRSGDIRILFNNVWSGNTADAPAKFRALQLAELYADYAPDIICLQEFSGVMNSDMNKYLKKMGYVEIPYETKNKNYAVRTPVFYNPKAITLVDSGYWAFNDTANDKSKSIGWGVFKDSNGKLFCVASTHFYWTSDELGEYAREIDATELSEQMKLVSEKYNGIPVIIGGDYNCRLGSVPLEIMKKNGFTDIENTAIKTEMGGTHHSYPSINSDTGLCVSYSKANGNHETAIDHIFSYSDKNLTVNLYDVVEDLLALASSDHCPMITDITLN